MQHTNNIMLHSYFSSFCWMVLFSCVCEKLCTVSSFSPKMGYSARAWLMIKDHANIPYTITNHRTVSLLISSILYHFLFYVCPLHSSYQPTCQPATITTAPLCAWARLVIWHFHSTKSYVTPYRFTLKSSWDHSIKTMHRDRELGGREWEPNEYLPCGHLNCTRFTIQQREAMSFVDFLSSKAVIKSAISIDLNVTTNYYVSNVERICCWFSNFPFHTITLRAEFHDGLANNITKYSTDFKHQHSTFIEVEW